MNYSDAYRTAYPHCKKWMAKSVWEKGSTLAAKAQVQARIDEIRAPVIEKARYTLVEAMTEAEDARKLAMESKQASAAVSAVQLRAKLNGLLVEDRQNERPPYSDYTEDELDRAIAATRRAIEDAQTAGAGAPAGKAETPQPE